MVVVVVFVVVVVVVLGVVVAFVVMMESCMRERKLNVRIREYAINALLTMGSTHNINPYMVMGNANKSNLSKMPRFSFVSFVTCEREKLNAKGKKVQRKSVCVCARARENEKKITKEAKKNKFIRAGRDRDGDRGRRAILCSSQPFDLKCLNRGMLRGLCESLIVCLSYEMRFGKSGCFKGDHSLDP